MTTLRTTFLAVPGESNKTLKGLFDSLTKRGFDLDLDISDGYIPFYALTDEAVEGFDDINFAQKKVLQYILAGELTWQPRVCGGLGNSLGVDYR